MACERLESERRRLRATPRVLLSRSWVDRGQIQMSSSLQQSSRSVVAIRPDLRSETTRPFKRPADESGSHS